jgi:hypothetical protein
MAWFNGRLPRFYEIGDAFRQLSADGQRVIAVRGNIFLPVFAYDPENVIHIFDQYQVALPISRCQ